MIVKCDQCQTRFKIPDEKVTAKGVKVRCTKCQHTFRVSLAPAAAPPPPPPQGDPFGSFGPDATESTRPGFYADGITASRTGLAPAVLGQHHDVSQEVFESPTRVVPLPKDLLAPASPPLFDPSDPFGSLDPSAPALPSPGFSGSPTDFESTSPGLPAYRPPPEAFAAPPAPAPATDPFSLLGELPAPTEPHPRPRAPAGFPPSDTATSTDLLGALPPLQDDPFARMDLNAAGEDFGAGPDAEPDRGLFDMPTPPPPLAAAEEPTLTAQATRIVPRPAPPSARSGPPPEKPQGRPDDMGMGEPSGAGKVRWAAGLVVNLSVASVLLVALVSVGSIFLNDGKLEPRAFSLAPLQALFSAPSDLRAVDVSNGLYDTRSGRPVFYVRGQVENRGPGPAQVKVRVEIVDGALSVGKAEANLGFAPSPEDLYAVGSPADLAALQQRGAPQGAELAPGGRAPFLLAFYDYPPDLSAYRLKVSVESASTEETAALPQDR